MTRLSVVVALLSAVLSLSAAAAVPVSDQVEVIEFYHQQLDHYFITADPLEASDLDTGVHPGWARTGFKFLAIKAGSTVVGSTPICRFYGSPEAHLDSHFYAATPSECADVKAKFSDSWLLESNEVFRAMPVDPSTGVCAADLEPIYRLWNDRTDVNHRYTDQLTILKDMVARGYIAEGNGNPTAPVVFCMPARAASTPPPPPSSSGLSNCTITSSSTAPTVGDAVTLTASCSDSPTAFSWTGCTATTNTCAAKETAPGSYIYGVTASNSKGAGPFAQFTLVWKAAAGSLPVCNIAATTLTPIAGTSLTLSANCSQTPTRYDWVSCSYMLQQACNFITSCSSTSSNCVVTQTAAGFAHYGVAAANGAGAGARVGLDVEWGSGSGSGGGGGAPPGPPLCSVIPSNSTPLIGSVITLSASCSGNPTSYAWTGCTSSGASCQVSSSTAGAATYTVVGSNAAGNGVPASAQVTWQQPAAPSCSVSASNTAPTVNQATTLTASCSGSPTSYTWTGCASTASTCATTSAVAGSAIYSVVAGSASGNSNTASVSVNWQPLPTAAPACLLTASKTNPFVGETITLTANCTNGPSSYAWTGCASTTATCTATSASAGGVTYSVSASNAVGPSAPAPVAVTWQQSTSPPDLCSAYPEVVRVQEPWGGGPTYPNNYSGSFHANAVLVISITVPAGAAGMSASAAEYGDPPTFRTVTMSRSPCDFRTYDASGLNGPFGIGYGTTATITARVGNVMLAGQTYYFNIRNASPDIGPTCKTSTCNIIVGYQWQ